MSVDMLRTLVLVLLMLTCIGTSPTVHLDCKQHGQSISPVEGGSPSLLVLENCSVEEVDYWLTFLESRFTRIYTLWLKGLVVVEQGSRERSAHCPGSTLVRQLDTIKVSGSEFQNGRLGRLTPLLRCAPVINLDLTHNHIGRVAGRLQAETVIRLNLSHSQLSEVDERLLVDAKELEELDLSNNRLVKIPTGLFRNTRRLTSLHLNNNIISFINRQSFIGLRHLRRLDLSGNDIASIWLQDQVFHHLSQLQFFNLSNNRITELDNGILLDLPELQLLDVSSNQISRLSRAPFQNQSKLVQLSLQHNLIANIDQTSLHGLSASLTSLNLAANKLKFIHRDALRNITMLKQLQLQENELEKVPEALSHLNQLTHLNLASNLIGQMPRDFMQPGSKLQELNLAANLIPNIVQDTFNNTVDISVINLARNEIGNIDQGSLVRLSNLTELDLAHNRLTEIDGVFPSLSSLRLLNVSMNQLKWFDMAFVPKQLLVVDIQGNHIEALGNYFKMVDGFSLKYLDASNNKISALGTHTFVDSLEDVNLASNNISDLGSTAFAGLQNLKRVDLRNNQLTTIPRNSLKISHAAGYQPSFSVSLNPLVCDCELEWLSGYAPGAGLNPRIADYGSLSCQPPLASPGGEPVPLSSVEEGSFLCSYTSHCFSLCRCCTFFACDCRMKCPDPCDCFHDQAWNLNMIQCGSRNLTEVLREIPMDSTILYLDDNQLSNLGTEKFLGRNKLSVLFLNSSGVETVNNRTFLGLWGLKKLHLENNKLETIPSDTWGESLEMEELYLHNNMITSIENSTFDILTKLRVLTLHGNKLFTLEIDSSMFDGLKTITLGRNLWECSCPLSLAFHAIAESVTHRVSQLTCTETDGSSQNILTYHSSCKDLDVQAVASQASTSPFVILLVLTAAAVIVLISVSVFLVMKRNSITRWIYAKSNSPKVEDQSQYSPMLKMPPPDLTLKRGEMVPSVVEYSAYLHYCLADDEYVKGVLAPKLESVDPRYQICLHQRDLPKSCTVGQAISHAVANSRCLLIFATPSYFLSNIPSYELQMILSEVLPRYTSYPVIVAVSQASILDVKARFRQIVGCQSDTWSYLEVSDILFYDRVVNLVQMGGGMGSTSSSDASSCSTKSTAASALTIASTLPSRMSGESRLPGLTHVNGRPPTGLLTTVRQLPPGRVISNPMNRFHHGSSPAPSESIYASVIDPASGDEAEPTYQTVYADSNTLYIDRNLDLVHAATVSPRFRIEQ